jgi:hypothetical protein
MSIEINHQPLNAEQHIAVPAQPSEQPAVVSRENQPALGQGQLDRAETKGQTAALVADGTVPFLGLDGTNAPDSTAKIVDAKAAPTAAQEAGLVPYHGNGNANPIGIYTGLDYLAKTDPKDYAVEPKAQYEKENGKALTKLMYPSPGDLPKADPTSQKPYHKNGNANPIGIETGYDYMHKIDPKYY